MSVDIRCVGRVDAAGVAGTSASAGGRGGRGMSGMTPERPHAAVLRIHENYRRGAPAAAGDVIALIEYAQAAELALAEVDRLRAQVADIANHTPDCAELHGGGRGHFCRECSEKANDYVNWPCPTLVGSAGAGPCEHGRSVCQCYGDEVKPCVRCGSTSHRSCPVAPHEVQS